MGYFETNRTPERSVEKSESEMEELKAKLLDNADKQQQANDQLKQVIVATQTATTPEDTIKCIEKHIAILEETRDRNNTLESETERVISDAETVGWNPERISGIRAIFEANKKNRFPENDMIQQLKLEMEKIKLLKGDDERKLDSVKDFFQQRLKIAKDVERTINAAKDCFLNSDAASGLKSQVANECSDLDKKIDEFINMQGEIIKELKDERLIADINSSIQVAKGSKFTLQRYAELLKRE